MEIRKLATAEEYREAEALQQAVWHFPDREIVSLNELIVTQRHGGHVFGAFDGGRMVAFCYGSPGYGKGKAYHYSHMLGVVPGQRDSGIGYTLKLKQRDFVLEQGLDLVVWTFDPLQSRNAYFNIEKLGCVIREYALNLYPDSESRLIAGLDSDRFTPEWWVRARRVKDRLAGRKPVYDLDDFEPSLETSGKDGTWRRPDAVRKIRSRRMSVEVPDDIDALKKDDLDLAKAWRAATRDAFVAAFKRGYVAHGFMSVPALGRRRSFYLLEKGYRVR